MKYFCFYMLDNILSKENALCNAPESAVKRLACINGTGGAILFLSQFGLVLTERQSP